MNQVVNMPEMAPVSAELYAQAKSGRCVCGDTVFYGVFCGRCSNLLERVERRFVWAPNINMRKGFTPLGCWYYDMAVDLLRDPNLATWKRKRKSEDEGYDR